MKYLLNLQTFIAEKLPEDGTLVPKHVGAGTLYEVCFVIYFISMQLVHYVGFEKYRINQKITIHK